MPISTPVQITVPFATSGLKNAIPSASNPVTGNAGYDAGFPATNMTPKEAGGIPPFGQDFNGILFDITTAIRFIQSGAMWPYNSSFATAIGGYNLGATVPTTDGTGSWACLANGITLGPEDNSAFASNWAPLGSGATTVAMSNASVTLTKLESSKNLIIITGTVTANIQLVFRNFVKGYTVSNRSTGLFSVTCKTLAGAGVVIPSGTTQAIYCDGVDMLATSAVSTQQSVVGSFANLKASSTGLSALVSVTADEVSLEAAAGNYLTVRAVNLTSLTLAGSGANGLDTGTSAASTWYSVWVISNGTTTAGLLSLSATAPTMPSGYTFKARVGWVRTDATANKYPLRFVQFGRSFQYAPAAATNLTTARLMASGASGNPASPPTWIAVAIANFVPTTASRIRVYITGYNGGTIAAPSTAYDGLSTSSTQGAPMMTSPPAGNSASNSVMGDFAIESANIYYASAGAASGITCIGFEDNI